MVTLRYCMYVQIWNIWWYEHMCTRPLVVKINVSICTCTCTHMHMWLLATYITCEWYTNLHKVAMCMLPVECFIIHACTYVQHTQSYNFHTCYWPKFCTTSINIMILYTYTQRCIYIQYVHTSLFLAHNNIVDQDCENYYEYN